MLAAAQAADDEDRPAPKRERKQQHHHHHHGGGSQSTVASLPSSPQHMAIFPPLPRQAGSSRKRQLGGAIARSSPGSLAANARTFGANSAFNGGSLSLACGLDMPGLVNMQQQDPAAAASLTNQLTSRAPLSNITNTGGGGGGGASKGTKGRGAAAGAAAAPGLMAAPPAMNGALAGLPLVLTAGAGDHEGAMPDSALLQQQALMMGHHHHPSQAQPGVAPLAASRLPSAAASPAVGNGGELLESSLSFVPSLGTACLTAPGPAPSAAGSPGFPGFRSAPASVPALFQPSPAVRQSTRLRRQRMMSPSGQRPAAAAAARRADGSRARSRQEDLAPAPHSTPVQQKKKKVRAWGASRHAALSCTLSGSIHAHIPASYTCA